MKKSRRPIISEVATSLLLLALCFGVFAVCNISLLAGGAVSRQLDFCALAVGSSGVVPTPWAAPSQVEQFQRALSVLTLARQLVVEGEEPLQAIAIASGQRIEGEYARRVLRLVLWEANLLEWQAHPATIQSARTRAFDRAIRLSRAAFGHRGGWLVAS